MRALWGSGWFAILMLVGCSDEGDSTNEPPLRSDVGVLEVAKGAAQAAFGRLSGELATAIAEGGPTHAIPVCSSKAGSLTGEVADEHGLTMKRLSDRPRNPDQRATGADLDAMEAMRNDPKPQLEWREDGTAVVRLPIVLNNPLCLKCHGGDGEIATETRAVLNERYPDDEATGYTMDDLRGIWRIEVPAAPVPAG